MPTYDYKCTKCEHEFSKVESIKEHDPNKVKCPECGAEVKQLLTAFYTKTSKKS